jgi:CheY-like chemotaxis protein
VRERNRSPRPLIVAVTGWGKPEDREKALQAGFDVHLTKPVEGPDLQRVLAQHPTLH